MVGRKDIELSIDGVCSQFNMVSDTGGELEQFCTKLADAMMLLLNKPIQPLQINKKISINHGALKMQPINPVPAPVAESNPAEEIEAAAPAEATVPVGAVNEPLIVPKTKFKIDLTLRPKKT